ncbi:MAG TPA: PRC-barrel domain-containing protein [Stellaceae bacterium]|nr:PRC-barrel domain-containing protein [Stellaceae bacterium]
MRVVSLTAAVLALSTGLAFAQMSPPGGGPAMPQPGTGAPGATAVPHVPAVNPLTAEDVSSITGTAVFGSGDQQLGRVSHVLMKPDTKTIDRLVVAQGGVFGIGAHNVALPLDQFKWDQQKEGFTVAKSADDLKSMAEWQDPSRQAMAAPGAGATPSH